MHPDPSLGFYQLPLYAVYMCVIYVYGTYT